MEKCLRAARAREAVPVRAGIRSVEADRTIPPLAARGAVPSAAPEEAVASAVVPAAVASAAAPVVGAASAAAPVVGAASAAADDRDFLLTKDGRLYTISQVTKQSAAFLPADCFYRQISAKER